jgi:glutaconyl-CoA/methylmalonyl-CoA decarboxylase subunit delta
MTALILQETMNPDKISDVVHHLDPYGIGITAIGMGVVFMSLLLLYVAFYNVSKLLLYRTKRKLRQQGKLIEEHDKEIGMDADVNAAIAVALSLYFQEVHDKESEVLTIAKTARTYSPWSSKIYGLRQYPR